VSARAVVATLLRPRGNKGELAAISQSSHPDRFASLKRVFVGGEERALESAWWHGDKLILKFVGVDSISDAEPLSGLDVEIPIEERVPLPPGEYYLTDLVGFHLFNRGEPVGAVTGWSELPGQVLLEAGGIDVPLAHVRQVDHEQKRIDADLPEGLVDLNR
jgi:16S rRNA processing protein RimM